MEERTSSLKLIWIGFGRAFCNRFRRRSKYKSSFCTTSPVPPPNDVPPNGVAYIFILFFTEVFCFSLICKFTVERFNSLVPNLELHLDVFDRSLATFALCFFFSMNHRIEFSRFFRQFLCTFFKIHSSELPQCN